MTTKKKQKHSVVVTVPRKRSTTAASQSKNPEALRAEIEIPLSSDTIRIRMYRVGFGDCFLVSIPDGDSAHKHILVDCGVHGKGNINTIDKVIDNIATVTGRKLSLVIATHSHQDHISGFDPVKFKGFEVAEVWLPWVEDPKNSIAIALRKKQTALAAKLYAHFVAEERHNPVKGTALKKRTKAVEALANVIGLSDEKAKLASNATALKLLNSGFGDSDRVRYLSAGETLKNPGGINGLKVKILGPPTDQKFLAKMD
ncbi:MAG: MBL fold metallo-hydrolase, partial [Bacteroidota bacterium]